MTIDSSKKILIIEDEVAVANLLAEQLSQGHIEVQKAHTLEDGIKQIKEFCPDIVITDILLEDQSGIDLIKQAKELTGNRNIKFIVLTNSSASEHIAQAVEEGVVAFLQKADVDPSAIYQVVAKYL